MVYLTLFIKYGKIFKVSPLILMSICQVESNLVNVVNHSDGGSKSYGICQVKQETAKMLGYKNINLLVVENNIKVAAHYLAKQYNRYDNNYNYAIAAYNAGKLNLTHTGEIRNVYYVRKVKKSFNRFTKEIIKGISL
jgi:soluble lytic murein transglycosylase-like protein